MKDKKYITRIASIVVLPEGEPMFSEIATKIEIRDDGSGEFLQVSQALGDGGKNETIIIEPREWYEIRKAISLMMKEIEKHEKKT